MRNERRKENKEFLDIKKVAYIAGSLIALAIIAFVITFFIYGNQLNKQTELGKLAMQDSYRENGIVEETSTQFGKTINEVSDSNNDLDGKSTVDKYAVNTSKLENTNTTSDNNIKANSTDKTKNNQASENSKSDTKMSKESNIENENPKFMKPVKGDITKEFAKDKLVYSNTLGEWITHNGIDIKAEKTTVVKAAADGTVKSIKNDPRYGLTVVIEHVNGFTTIYSNLLTAEFIVAGEEVKQDQTIGTVGNTATFEIADEPHLHFEILKDSKNLDPELYIKN